MEVDNVANVVAEMVGDMEVDRVADELDMLVAKVAEEVADTVKWYSEMTGLKCVKSFYGGKHSEFLYLRCLNETDLKF